jgi:hypothetical protein
MCVFFGEYDEFQTYIDEIVALLPKSATTEVVSYFDLQTRFDSNNGPGKYYWTRSNFLLEINEKISDRILRSFAKNSFDTTIEMMCLGGFDAQIHLCSFSHSLSCRKIKETPQDSAAFVHRNAKFEVHAITRVHKTEQLPEVTAWSSEFANEIAQFSTGAYANFHVSNPERTFGTNYSKLRKIKSKYDPQNVFRSNHNILPG